VIAPDDTEVGAATSSASYSEPSVSDRKSGLPDVE
jgi:hypothetical protein